MQRHNEGSHSHQTDLNAPEFYRDRRATYKTLRDRSPVAFTELNGERTAVLTRFKDAESILRDPSGAVQPAAGEFPAHLGHGEAATYYRLSAPGVDDPEHTRLRKVLNESFSVQGIRGMEEWVDGIIAKQIDAVSGPTIDFVSEIAVRIPIEVVCRLMDMPSQDAGRLLQHIHDMTAIFSQAEMSPDALNRSNKAAAFYFEYFGKHLDGSRGLSEHGFTRALVRAESEGRFSREDSLCAMIDVFIAGIHTTTTALTNAIHAFGRNPEQWRLLMNNESLVPRAWDEVLRYDPPVHFRHRYVTEPVVLHGLTIEPRVKIMIGLASANWDETVFDNADTFDITRPTPRNVAFGGGRHFCLGMHLARLEGKLFLPRFIARYPNFQLVNEESPRIEDLTFPHYSNLAVNLGTAT